MTDVNADNTGAQTTDAGTQQADAGSANAQATSTQQQPAADANAAAQGDQGQAQGQTNGNALPEKYEFTMPEGIEVDTELADEFSAVAKELNLKQEDAQKVAGIGGKLAQKFAEKQAAIHNEQVSNWKAETAKDAEFGGEKLAANLAVANKTFSTFGTPQLRELLDKSGLGEHPEVIRWAYRVGQAISEDKFVPGGNANSGGAKDPASIMFPSMNQSA